MSLAPSKVSPPVDAICSVPVPAFLKIMYQPLPIDAASGMENVPEPPVHVAMEPRLLSLKAVDEL